MTQRSFLDFGVYFRYLLHCQVTTIKPLVRKQTKFPTLYSDAIVAYSGSFSRDQELEGLSRALLSATADIPNGPCQQQTSLCSRGDALICTEYVLDMGLLFFATVPADEVMR